MRNCGSFTWMPVLCTPALPLKFAYLVFWKANRSDILLTGTILIYSSIKITWSCIFWHILHWNAGLFCSKFFSHFFLWLFLSDIDLMFPHYLFRCTSLSWKSTVYSLSLLSLWSLEGAGLTPETRTRRGSWASELAIFQHPMVSSSWDSHLQSGDLRFPDWNLGTELNLLHLKNFFFLHYESTCKACNQYAHIHIYKR